MPNLRTKVTKVPVNAVNAQGARRAVQDFLTREKVPYLSISEPVPAEHPFHDDFAAIVVNRPYGQRTSWIVTVER